MSKVVVVGGGPAGMFAGITAASNGHEVILVERNEKLDKKLYITGKGRCNLTNTAEGDEFFKNIPRNPKFLMSAISRFSSVELMDWFNNNGVPLKEERGKRVFPVSEKASDITKALTRKLNNLGVEIRLNEKVVSINKRNEAIESVSTDKGIIPCDAVILATGGLSYSVTGSTGDGYKFASELGHTITETAPVLVPIICSDSWCGELQGLSLKNIVLSVEIKGKTVYEELGEMLFTHNGISGPLVLSLSSVLQGRELNGIKIFIDLKPGLNHGSLDKRIQRDISENLNKSIKNVAVKLMATALVPIILSIAGINPDKPVNQMAKEERSKLAGVIKALPIGFKGFGTYDEAVVTRGGVSVKEINPMTMQSKIVRGLYFAGEMIDVDGFTGGFNLQIAFSTGFIAGNSI